MQATLHTAGSSRTFECKEEESVQDALSRAGINIPAGSIVRSMGEVVDLTQTLDSDGLVLFTARAVSNG